MTVPDQLREYPLIRLCGPDCIINSHGDCNSAGKRPIHRDWQNRDNQILDIRRHIRNVGNYGVVPRSTNNLLVIDADDEQFTQLVTDNLKPTLTVETGNGHHFYFRSDWSQNKRWSDTIDGEIKATNSQVVGPGSDHPNGDSYRITRNRELASLTTDNITQFIRSVNQAIDVERGGSGVAAAAASPHHIPDSLEFIRKDRLQQKVAGILTDSDASHHDRVWLAGWLYGAAGLRESEIVELVMNEATWSNLDRGQVEQGVSSVIESSRSARGTHYSNYSDDGGKSGNPSEDSPGKTMATEWNTTVTEKNGMVVCRAGIEHIDPNKADMDSWDTVSLLFGEMETDEEFGDVPTWDNDQYGNQATKQLGNKSPNDLRMAAKALESLADQMEDS